jgi:hypothetical protein
MVRDYNTIDKLSKDIANKTLSDALNAPQQFQNLSRVLRLLPLLFRVQEDFLPLEKPMTSSTLTWDLTLLHFL